jgi:hypothetical protein
LKMEVDEFVGPPGTALVFGSGSKLFEGVARKLHDAGTPRDAAEVFVRALQHPEAADAKVGGLPEWITAGEAGASLPLVLNFSLDAAGSHTESILGMRIDGLGPIDGLGIGFSAVEPDSMYRLGERILRDRGVVEEDTARRESMRDLACIEYFVDLFRKLPSEPGRKIMPGLFYLSAFEPTPGHWCYCGRCRQCSADVPLFSDNSGGEVRHPLIGADLVSRCRRCGAEYRETSSTTFPLKWPKKVGNAIFR